MSQPALAFSPTVIVIDGKPSTTSNEVAAHFGKQHLHVMERIRSLLPNLPAEHQSDFRLVEFTDAKGEKRPAYRLTRDGFTLLAMGFTGKKALAFKLAYIDAFNRMEAELSQPAQDAQRLQLAQTLASQAGAQVMQTVFDAVMSGRNADWRRARYLLSFGYDQSGQPSLPMTKEVADGQIIASLPELTQHIAKADIMPSDTQLAALASACTQRLTERAQIRERRTEVAAPAPATSTLPAHASPHTSPRIGHDGKPLPPDTFRAVFV
ncbi:MULTISPECIES: Rha family transcriptional regulator [Comamonas]|uniref:Rha family transcriptional regulator n=1 Tax=Comamonas TaxID=283 RepID=UPI002580B852|nr:MULTISPECIES: Rha family transcriptional regulator [Comamonas]